MTAGDPPFPDPSTANALAPGCERCPDLAASRTCIAWGNGPRDADVFVVGEAPGAGDPDAETWRGGNHTGLAYTSRHSGRRIRSLMAELGHPDAYYTNAVKCFPADGEGSNREPSDEELANCREYLRAELADVDPEVVVTTGRHATATLLAVEGRDVDGFLELVCEPQECPTLGVRVLPVLHPSYQNIWRARLGYDADEYRAAIAERLP